MQANIYRTCELTQEKLNRLDKQEFKPEPFYQETLKQKQNDTEQCLINLHPEATFNSFQGFGAAITESAASAWMKMSQDKKAEFIRAYFSTEDGLGYTFGRISIHSCDFSLSPYSYVEENDFTLDSFDISREEELVIPMIKAAMDSVKDIKLLASPWSPPPYMKDNGEWQGGYLKPECYQLWADYIRKYILEMKKRGIELWGVTTQNETRHHQSWESCVYTAEQEAKFVKENLGPSLDGTNTKIFVYDHCKERIFERCLKYYNDFELKKYIDGIACHWYSGDHFGEIELCRKIFPDKEIIMSEGCTFSSEKSMIKPNAWKMSEKYAHDIMGNLNAGLDVFFDWNITLNEECGPHHWREGRNHCDAAIFCDTKNNELVYHPNYYMIGQFSKFIRPGAVRIGLSSYTSKLEATAFRNTDGSIATVVYNNSNSDIKYTIRVNGMLLERESKPHSVETVSFMLND